MERERPGGGGQRAAAFERLRWPSERRGVRAIAAILAWVCLTGPSSADEGEEIYRNPLSALDGLTIVGPRGARVAEKDGFLCAQMAAAPGLPVSIAVALPVKKVAGRIVGVACRLEGAGLSPLDEGTSSSVALRYKMTGDKAFTTAGESRLAGSFDWTLSEALGEIPSEAAEAIAGVWLPGPEGQVWARDLKVTVYNRPPSENVLFSDGMDDIQAWTASQKQGVSQAQGKYGKCVGVPANVSLTRDLDAGKMKGKIIRLMVTGRIGESVRRRRREAVETPGMALAIAEDGRQGRRLGEVSFGVTDVVWTLRGASFRAPDDLKSLRLRITQEMQDAGPFLVDSITLEGIEMAAGIDPLGWVLDE